LEGARLKTIIPPQTFVLLALFATNIIATKVTKLIINSSTYNHHLRWRLYGK